MPVAELYPGGGDWKPNCDPLRTQPQGGGEAVGKEQAEQHRGGATRPRYTLQHAGPALHVQVRSVTW